MDRLRLSGRADSLRYLLAKSQQLLRHLRPCRTSKDRYYMYRARWNEQQHTTHLLPHWNWKGREGQVTPVYCYTDGVEGELFVNGNSRGRVRKDKSSRLDRYRLRWNNVKYEPGEIRVVTYNQYGEKVGEDVKRTAGEPAQMKFSVETPIMSLLPAW